MDSGAMLVSAVVSIIVVVAGKAFDAKIAKEGSEASSAVRTEDHLWTRVAQLEKDRDRISEERDECREKLASVTGRCSVLEGTVDQQEQRIEHMAELLAAHGIRGAAQ